MWYSQQRGSSLKWCPEQNLDERDRGHPHNYLTRVNLRVALFFCWLPSQLFFWATPSTIDFFCFFLATPSTIVFLLFWLRPPQLFFWLRPPQLVFLATPYAITALRTHWFDGRAFTYPADGLPLLFVFTHQYGQVRVLVYSVYLLMFNSCMIKSFNYNLSIQYVWQTGLLTIC